MKISTLILGSALLMGSVSASAEIIVGDWKVQGDGLLRLDTQSGLEWIDTELTFRRSITELQETFGQGGEFEGFRVANNNDVEGMVASMFGYSLVDEFIPGYARYENENGIMNYYAVDLDESTADLTNSERRAYTEIFESYFSTGLVEQSYYNREEEVFIYDRFLYLSDGFDVLLDGKESTDVLTLTGYVKQSVDGKYTYKDESSFTFNDNNGTLTSSYASIFLVSDDLVSYSSLNDSSYLKAKEEGLANVNAPLTVFSLLSVAGLGFLRKRKIK